MQKNTKKISKKVPKRNYKKDNVSGFKKAIYLSTDHFRGFHIATKFMVFLCLLSVFTYGGIKTFAWTPPTGDPLQNNVYAPVNVGPIAQNKEGDLTIGGKKICLADGTNCVEGEGGSYPYSGEGDWTAGGVCSLVMIDQDNPSKTLGRDGLIAAGDFTNWMNPYKQYTPNQVCQHYGLSCDHWYYSHDNTKYECGHSIDHWASAFRWWPHSIFDNYGGGAVACCQANTICGNGAVENGETCDNGNKNGNEAYSGGYCSSVCKKPVLQYTWNSIKDFSKIKGIPDIVINNKSKILAEGGIICYGTADPSTQGAWSFSGVKCNPSGGGCPMSNSCIKVKSIGGCSSTNGFCGFGFSNNMIITTSQEGILSNDRDSNGYGGMLLDDGYSNPSYEWVRDTQELRLYFNN